MCVSRLVLGLKMMMTRRRESTAIRVEGAKGLMR
jgi:hypothetical protein